MDNLLPSQPVNLLDLIAIEAMKSLLQIHGGEGSTIARMSYKIARDMVSERDRLLKNPNACPHCGA